MPRVSLLSVPPRSVVPEAGPARYLGDAVRGGTTERGFAVGDPLAALAKVRGGESRFSSPPIPVSPLGSGGLSRVHGVFSEVSRKIGSCLRRMDMLAYGLWAFVKQPFHVRVRGADEETVELILKPGALVWNDPRQKESWNHFGRKNSYYHEFRRLAGVLDAADFSMSPPIGTSKLLAALVEEGFLEFYNGRAYEFAVTDKSLRDKSGLKEFLRGSGMPPDEAEEFLWTLWRFHGQRGKRISLIDGQHLETLPYVYIGEGEIDLLEHHRIRGAMDFGIPIKVRGIREKVTFN